MLVAGPALAKDQIRSRSCTDPATVAANCINRLNTIAVNRADCLATIADNAADQIAALLELGQTEEAEACAATAAARVDTIADATVLKINTIAEACAENLDEDLAEQVLGAAETAVGTITTAQGDAIEVIEGALE